MHCVFVVGRFTSYYLSKKGKLISYAEIKQDVRVSELQSGYRIKALARPEQVFEGA